MAAEWAMLELVGRGPPISAQDLRIQSGMNKPIYLNFDKAAFHRRPDLDYRAIPELYRVGKGGQDGLGFEPYKGAGAALAVQDSRGHTGR
jgi:hypothetical protein